MAIVALSNVAEPKTIEVEAGGAPLKTFQHVVATNIFPNYITVTDDETKFQFDFITINPITYLNYCLIQDLVSFLIMLSLFH